MSWSVSLCLREVLLVLQRFKAALADCFMRSHQGLALIQEVEREIVHERERLEDILKEVAINDPASCSQEIKILEREIGDLLAEWWTPIMIALVWLLRYAKCVLFSAATLRPLDYKILYFYV
ncbi:hypothetical protein ZWY2020_006906 [Hordeum vulgare]|nr:hypothetical protein ZWY2020_006906 [Hordeum vulgare]